MKTLATVTALILSASAGFAQSTSPALSLTDIGWNPDRPFGFSVGVSSVGLTGELSYVVTESWRLRAMASRAPTYRTGEAVAGISYDATARLGGVSLLADRRLGQSNFRFTFGGFISLTDAQGSASGALQIGDNIYPLVTLDAKAEFENPVSPIIALGYDWHINDRWTFSGSAGYIYTGGIDVTMNAAGVLPGDLLKEALEAEAELDEGYPFIEISLYFRF